MVKTLSALPLAPGLLHLWSVEKCHYAGFLEIPFTVLPICKTNYKIFYLVYEEPNRLYIIPAVFQSLQWLPSWCRLCVCASTLQRKSTFYNMFVAKYVLISIMLYIKMSGYNVCTNM